MISSSFPNFRVRGLSKRPSTIFRPVSGARLSFPSCSIVSSSAVIMGSPVSSKNPISTTGFSESTTDIGLMRNAVLFFMGILKRDQNANYPAPTLRFPKEKSVASVSPVADDRCYSCPALSHSGCNWHEAVTAGGRLCGHPSRHFCLTNTGLQRGHDHGGTTESDPCPGTL